MTCAALYDEYITLSWNAPDNPNGDLVQYIVTVLNTSNNQVNVINTNSTSTTFDVHGLSPGNELNFKKFHALSMYDLIMFLSIYKFVSM